MKKPLDTEVVFAAFDVNNLWHSARDIYGDNARVDFEALIKQIQLTRHSDVDRKVTAVAYTITAPHRRVLTDGRVKEEPPRNDRFLKSLKRFGFIVRTREMRYEKGTEKPFHTDWDVGIAVEALTTLELFHTFVIFSGDGDYLPLLKKLKELGKKIEVYTFRKVTSRHLYDVADHMHFLSEDAIYLEGSRTNGNANTSKDQEEA